jgi:hypothetical protein
MHFLSHFLLKPIKNKAIAAVGGPVPELFWTCSGGRFLTGLVAVSGWKLAVTVAAVAVIVAGVAVTGCRSLSPPDAAHRSSGIPGRAYSIPWLQCLRTLIPGTWLRVHLPVLSTGIGRP